MYVLARAKYGSDHRVSRREASWNRDTASRTGSVADCFLRRRASASSLCS